MIVPPDLHKGGRCGINRGLEGALGDLGGARVEVVAKREGGETFPAEMSIAAIQGGGLAAFTAHFRDVTATKHAADADRLLAAIVESSDDAIIAKDLEDVITSWNEGAARLFGYSAGEAVGRHYGFLVPSDCMSEADQVLERVRGGERVKNLETRRRTKDGRIVEMLLSVSPLLNSEGRNVGSSVVVRDISERKRAEQALRRSESEARRLALVASRTDNAVIITDGAGRIEWVNDGFTRICGYTLAEVVGRKPGAILQGPATDPATVRRIRDRLAVGEGFDEEIYNYGKSGRGYWLAISVQPIRDEAGVLTNFIAIESDITARKRDEAELRRAEEAYRGIFENSIEGIYQATSEGRYLRANPALARLYGYETPEEFIAESLDIGRQAYVDPRREQEFRRLIDEQGVVANFESRVRHRDGRVIWISETARAVRDDDGVAVSYEGTVADVTERRRAEFEILALNAELEAAYDSTIKGWAKALDLRDKETEGHSRRVTEMSLRLAHALGIKDEALVQIQRGALLHDIGKLGIPDSVLLKPGQLTAEEWEVMKRHPVNAREWLESIPVLRPALDIPYSHHEKWDGSGYPQGLSGRAIPLAARLFAAVDIWDALRSDRPYRAGWPEERVRAHLRSLAGNHLDPEITAIFLEVLEQHDASHGGSPREMTPRRAQAISHDSVASGRRQTIHANSGPLPIGGEWMRRPRPREVLERENARLAELATTDDLTGLRNRRAFRESLQSTFNAAVRQGQPLTLLLLDLDEFKAYNDDFGHPVGDEVLRELAVILKSEMRARDLVARYGGEEFTFLMLETDGEGGLALADRLRAAMSRHRWPRRPVTASFGLATRTSEMLAPDDLVELADRAMYQAKRLGRNRLMRSDDLAVPAFG